MSILIRLVLLQLLNKLWTNFELLSNYFFCDLYKIMYRQWQTLEILQGIENALKSCTTESNHDKYVDNKIKCIKLKQKTPRISRFSAFVLAKFTEYTAWAAFGECQEVLRRFAFFVISQSKYANEVLKYTNEVFNMRIYNKTIQSSGYLPFQWRQTL